MKQIIGWSDRATVQQTLVKAILGGSVSITTYFGGILPAQAQEMFGNEGIQFNVDTIIEFEFVSSHGAYQSTFGVIDLDTGQKTPLFNEAKASDIPQNINQPSNFQRNNGEGGDFEGSAGQAVPTPLTEFEFEANKRYAFYLESIYNDKPTGLFFSVDAQNPTRTQRAQFEGGVSGLSNGGTLIRWDDTGSVLVKPRDQDTDFDDFIVRSGGNLACPFSKKVSSRSFRGENCS